MYTIISLFWCLHFKYISNRYSVMMFAIEAFWKCYIIYCHMKAVKNQHKFFQSSSCNGFTWLLVWLLCYNRIRHWRREWWWPTLVHFWPWITTLCCLVGATHPGAMKANAGVTIIAAAVARVCCWFVWVDTGLCSAVRFLWVRCSAVFLSFVSPACSCVLGVLLQPERFVARLSQVS